MQIDKTNLLDLKGLVMESYFSGKDPMAIKGSGIKSFVNTAEFGVGVFISKYFEPILDIVDSPLNIIAVADAGNYFRKNVYHKYKTRDKSGIDPVEEAEIKKALRLTAEFLKALGVPIAFCEGQEADDVLAYLVSKLPGKKVIHTVDRDILQLVSDTCYVFRGGSFEYAMSDDGIIIPPNLIAVYKSIVGDPSDTYPGCVGVGKKGYLSMLEEFDEDGMLELGEILKARDRKKLQEVAGLTTNKAFHKCFSQVNDWFKMYELACLHPEVCEGTRGDKMIEINWTKRAPCLERLETVANAILDLNIVKTFSKFCYRKTLVTKHNLEACLQALYAQLENTPVVAWDYETYDPLMIPEYKEASTTGNFVDMRNSEITGCSFAVGPNLSDVYYFSVFHADTDNVSQFVIRDIIDHIENRGIPMVAQNLYFEATITLCRLKKQLKKSSTLDTKLFAHHLDENDRTGLKHLSKRYLNYTQATYAETLAAAGASDMSKISGNDVLQYACDDALVTGHLLHLLVIKSHCEGTYDFIVNYECPAVREFCKAHVGGVAVDAQRMAELTEKDRVTAEVKMAYIREMLEKHCSEPAFEHVDTLMADQEDYLKVKVKEGLDPKKLAQSEISQRVKDKLREIATDYKKNSYYRPLKEKKDYKPFLPTVAGFARVTELLGLPAIQKVSSTGIEDYLLDNLDKCMPGTRQAEFLKLLGPAESGFQNLSKELKTRSSDAYFKLETFCNSLVEENALSILEGTELNMGSPKQNQTLFYLLLKLPIRMRTKVQTGSLRHKFRLVGSPATNKIAIAAALAFDCGDENAWKADVLKAIQDYKDATTRTKIYWNTYPLWLKGGGEGLIYPGTSSCGTVTRRPTGSQPNLLQVQKGDVRTVFIPRKVPVAGLPERLFEEPYITPVNVGGFQERVIVSIDFSSQELRLNADQCQDPTFMSAYIGEVKKDLHAITGCGIAKVLLSRAGYAGEVKFAPSGKVDYDFLCANKDSMDDRGELTPIAKILSKARSGGKTTNFSAQFGASGPTLAINLLSTVEEADLYIEEYNSTFPMLGVWKRKVVKEAKIKGYTTTAYGSRRHVVPGINCGDMGRASRWERQAINFNIQGTAADILKVVLTNTSESNFFDRHDAHFIAAIYDEIVADVPVSNLYLYCQELCGYMNITPPGGTIPMEGDCSFGPSWGKQYEVGGFPSYEKVLAAVMKMRSDAAPDAVETDDDVKKFFDQELYEYDDEEEAV